jgi:chorismate mutase/prephenate dehydratase
MPNFDRDEQITCDEKTGPPVFLRPQAGATAKASAGTGEAAFLHWLPHAALLQHSSNGQRKPCRYGLDCWFCAIGSLVFSRKRAEIMSHPPSERHSPDCKHPDADTAGGAVGRMDEIDHLLLQLLAERGDIAYELATTQVASNGVSLSPKLDYDRLQKLDEFWRNHIESRFPLPGAQQVLKDVFGICSTIVAPRRIAYLGPPGTFSHMALLQEFGSSSVQIESSTIAAVFAAVERDDAEYGVVPMENSIEGSITHTHDCFLRTRLMICGEFVLDVRLCLVAKELDLSKIELVYSHPQPLAQCRTWLSTHLPRAETVACSSTTAAAQMAATNPKAALQVYW